MAVIEFLIQWFVRENHQNEEKKRRVCIGMAGGAKKLEETRGARKREGKEEWESACGRKGGEHRLWIERAKRAKDL